MTTTQQRVFPVISPQVAAALSDEPILVDGMKVAFDVKVALYPVTLRKPDSDRRANGARNGA